MDSTIVGAVAGIIVAVIAYFGGREAGRASRATANAVDVETLRKLIADVESQHKQIISLQNEIEEIKDKLQKLENKNTALWKYVYALIDFIKKHGLVPPPPPVELDSDPKLMELLK